MREPSRPPCAPWWAAAALLLALPPAGVAQLSQEAPDDGAGIDRIERTDRATISDEVVPSGCGGMVRAEVVALDQPFAWNRYGAVQPQGMMYALKRDVVDLDDPDGLPSPGEVQAHVAGQVQLRRDKRPRPLVLRVNAGQCLRIYFTNLLHPVKPTDFEHEEQPATRAASIHVIGLQLVESETDDGSYVGENATSVALPGETRVYTLYAEREGGYVMHSMGAIAGGEGDSGSIAAGLFGAVNVEPADSEWYRSQVTKAELDLARVASPDQHPRIDYNALYPTTHPHYPGLPIFKMQDAGGFIVHSDLTAIITGPNAGNLTGYLPSTSVYPQRSEPFREFTIIFHDEIGAIQAFPQFGSRELHFTLHSARDAFAINYGTGGIGAEVLANRFEVGPVHDCVECKYEEFFLTSWAVGDPAMIVDVPANFPCGNDLKALHEGEPCTPTPGAKATKAFYPDDPSNVYHSYLNDHVKFRNLHAGSDDHHIFHLHAHQWLHTPRSDLSAYLDSQAIGQGAGFTYEIAYEGSGNRNKTVGDSIFHCHFYPHFAQGMWGMWRVHDVLETGTELDAEGRPAAGSRALPDGEIAAGTPIPAVVPIPTNPMAPLPGPIQIAGGEVVLPTPVVTNPGFPFFVPGRAGHRPPHPPLDTVHDGGLPRHVAQDGGQAVSHETRFDFTKEIEKMNVDWLAEAGEPVEQVAMSFHFQPGGGYTTPRPKPGGGTGLFEVNVGAPRPGAPYADPCAYGASGMRYYKAADIQLDVKLNKTGWHFPQQRMIALWEDVDDLLAPNPTKPPEPFFFRAQANECIEFQLTNLVPKIYELDDFQVRTPTDIIGQHIHLVKFDVTASDGAGNGFNYEDGSFSPEEVQERICAIRQAQPDRCGEPAAGTCSWAGELSVRCPKPEVHPFFTWEHDANCDGENDFLGAQTTVQRWWADPITVTSTGNERTLRTVFTHDHFGPSTHQQAGLYGGLVIEPEGSVWLHNETGQPLATRNTPDGDGGPTSWQAVIQGDSAAENYREFMIEFADFQLAYEPDSPVCPDPTWGFVDRARAINPPGRKLVGPPVLYEKPDECPVPEHLEGIVPPLPPPCPEAVSADDPGMTVVNYRNEPVALRVSTPADAQTPGRPGDLSFAYATRRDRARWEYNVFPSAPALAANGITYSPLTFGLRRGDPFTPLLRAYEGDRVVVRVLTGAHEEEHNVTVHGMKWLFEPDWPNSGYRNSQNTGISEWFDFVIPRMPSLRDGELADFLYKPTAASEWQWNGAWGLVRLYRGPRGGRSSSPSTALAAATAGTSTDATAGSELTPRQDPEDTFQPDDLDTLEGEEPLEVLALQNPDARAEEGTGYAEVSVSEAEADGVVLSGSPEREASLESNSPTSPTTGAVVAASTTGGTIRITCPAAAGSRQPAFLRAYEIWAVSAAEALQNDPITSLVYNSRTTSAGAHAGPLHDPTAIMFVHRQDLVFVGGRPRLVQNVLREPLVIRANAGDCIKVKLVNALPAGYADADGWNAMPMIVEGFNANDVRPSRHVALHPQLVTYDVRRADGSNAGLNPRTYARQTVAPGEAKTFYWYAGDLSVSGGTVTPIPIEFGSTGLSSSDPIKHPENGAVGAMIIEPQGSTWTFDNVPDQQSGGALKTSRASATVTTGTRSFKEFVLVIQDSVNLQYGDGAPVESLVINEDPTESAQKAINYRTEPLWFRQGFSPLTPLEQTREETDYHLLLSNTWIGGDPETPVFTAGRNQATRFRLVHPAGHSQAHAFDLHGHVWEELPYTNASRSIGNNPPSEWMGVRGGIGPTGHAEAIPKNGAGGKFGVAADYLYRDYAPWLLDGGIWGLLRVVP